MCKETIFLIPIYLKLGQCSGAFTSLYLCNNGIDTLEIYLVTGRERNVYVKDLIEERLQKGISILLVSKMFLIYLTRNCFPIIVTSTRYVDGITRLEAIKRFLFNEFKENFIYMEIWVSLVYKFLDSLQINLMRLYTKPFSKRKLNLSLLI